MELVIALTIGVLAGSGLWPLLRPRTFQVIIGLSLMSYAVNLFVFSMGRLRIGAPPILDPSVTNPAYYADPVPQALVLTAIVISFSMTARVSSGATAAASYRAAMAAPFCTAVEIVSDHSKFARPMVRCGASCRAPALPSPERGGGPRLLARVMRHPHARRLGATWPSMPTSRRPVFKRSTYVLTITAYFCVISGRIDCAEGNAPMNPFRRL